MLLFKPNTNVTIDTVDLQFIKQTLVLNFIECLLEIQIYDIYRYAFIVHIQNVMEEAEQVCRAWTFIKEAMLWVGYNNIDNIFFEEYHSVVTDDRRH